ncbi:MAG: type VI secretion system-associated FHA domain protein TagH [Pseudomonas sp.]|uniref:type VI secretion system-associated FHA domain protein TagH n=1 Tax=Pseudomonas sp. TaxID=306 RepID=UPI0033960665
MSAPTMELRVLAYNGIRLETDLSRSLGAGELTVGRSPGNDLALDDPDRLISRFQATLVRLDAGSARLVNVSSSSTLLINQTELPPGGNATVRINDRLLVGRYLLALESLPQAASVLTVSPQLPAAHLTIPADFDVFAVPPPEPSVPQAEISLADFSDAQGALKAVFADAPAQVYEPLPESLGDVRSRTSALEISSSSTLDPLAMFASADSGLDALLAPPSLEMDHGFEVDALFHAPVMAVAPAVAAPPVAVAPLFEAPPPAIEPPLRDDLLFELPAEALLAPSSGQTLETPPVVIPPVPVAAAIPVPTPAPAPNHAPSAVAVAPVAAPAALSDEPMDSAALRAAFARGSGLAETAVPAITATFMESLGGIFARMTAGTIRLMHARSAIKHEIRANVTIIASAGNNPLKFAPDGTSAVVQLLGHRFPGFMESQRAVEDAFDDLSAHQVGLLAGARTAMYEVIGRFSPERLKQRLGNQSLLESLMPSMRKAKLWELYEQGFVDLAGEAREEFEALFQQAFARAYEAEIERVCAGRDE